MQRCARCALLSSVSYPGEYCQQYLTPKCIRSSILAGYNLTERCGDDILQMAAARQLLYKTSTELLETARKQGAQGALLMPSETLVQELISLQMQGMPHVTMTTCPSLYNVLSSTLASKISNMVLRFVTARLQMARMPSRGWRWRPVPKGRRARR